MSPIHAAGHVFRCKMTPVEVTSLHRPDEHWSYTDPAGHEHFWTFNGQRGAYNPAATTIVPSIVWVKDGEEYWEYWEDSDEPHDVGHHECRECGANVKLGYCADDTQVFIAGLQHYYIDDELVSREAFAIAVEQATGFKL